MRFTRSTRSLTHTLRRWRQSARVYWVILAVLTMITYRVANDELTQIAESKRRFGTTAQVLVARSAFPAGSVLTINDVRRVEVPDSVAPAGSMTDLDQVGRLRFEIGAGEILVDSRFTHAASSPTAAAIPSGSVGVALPLATAHLPLRPGDEVDLLAITSRGVSDTIVEGALVIATEELVVTVAVPERLAGVVSDATLAGTITLTLRGPD